MAGKTSDKKKKEIIAYYIECQNYSETARKFNVADHTVERIVRNDPDTAKKIEQKKKENTADVLAAMKDRSKRIIQITENLLNAVDEKATKTDMFTNVKDYATAYGIIIDKELKKKEVELKEKELELKEKELAQKKEADKNTLEKLDEVLGNIKGVV